MDEQGAAKAAEPTVEDRARAAEERARALEGRLEIERTARRMGIVDEDAAYRLLDNDRLQWDDAGRPRNVEALLRDLIAERPWLRMEGATASEASASPANPSGGGGRRLTREAIRRMTSDEINAQWDAVVAALRTGI